MTNYAYAVEKPLAHCNYCSGECDTCTSLEDEIGELLALRAQEISVLEDRYDADVDYHMSIA
jgi:hypothetical protein